MTKLYHMSNLGILVAFPGIALWPGAVDFVLGFAFPVHSHIGMNYVVTDYVPKAMRTAATHWSC